jgi:hypothetical protein
MKMEEYAVNKDYPLSPLNRKTIFVSTMVIFIAWVCSAKHTMPASGGPAQGEEKYALLIGIDAYQGGRFKPLEGAKNDVKMMKRILTQRFQFKPENITTLLDGKATHGAIKTAFQRLSDRAPSNGMIYIHYSGHGSYTCDLNGDEPPAWGRDSTWVSYGTRATSGSEKSRKDCAAIRESQTGQPQEAARSITPEALNDYDVLDDEIHTWLAALSQKTDHVIFVSDSCHSGTVTRGDALMTRGVPIDLRPHPLGRAPVSKKPLKGLSVTACRDKEKASEYMVGDKVHGLFTWFWAQGLEGASPQETWGDLYKRVCAKIRNEGGNQQPQIKGTEAARGRVVFGGLFPERQKTIAVTSVSYDGKRASIEAGKLLGVTRGSVYRKSDPQGKEKSRPAMEITRTHPTWSEGRISGTFKVGDLVVLEHYQHNTAPMKVFVRADLKKDQSLVDRIKEKVAALPAYEITGKQKESDLVLQILRPEKDKNGKYKYKRKDDSLPQSFADQVPSCWILTPDERLKQEKLRIRMDDPVEGVRLVCENLTKIASVENLVNLSSAPGQKSFVQLHITIWNRAKPGGSSETIEVEGNMYQKERTVTARELEVFNLKVNQVLTFSIHNTSDRAYYMYLIDVTSDGKIIPFYPKLEHGNEYAYVSPGGTRDIKEVTLFIDQPGREYIRLIASLKPIDIYLLEQKGFKTRSATKGGKLNPLEALLCTKAGLTRGRTGGAISTAEWATVQGAFKVGR